MENRAYITRENHKGLHADDLVGGAASFFVFVLTIIAVLTLVMEGVDQTVTSYIQGETVDFVDTVRTDGKIDPDLYQQYESKILGTKSYSIDVEVYEKKLFPGSESTTGAVTAAYAKTDDQVIRDYMFGTNSKRPYYLNAEDRIKVTVKRTGPGLTAFASIINMEGKYGQIVSEYSGMVLHDGVIR